MDGGLLLGLASLVVTVVAGALTLIALIRQFPRRRLELTTTSEILLPGVRPDLEPKLADFKNPYLVSVQLKSSSRADIATSMFDAGRSLVCRFQQPIFEVPDAAEGDLQYSIQGREIRFAPQLLRANSSIRLSIVAENSAPTYGLESPLIDIPVLSRHHETPVTVSLARAWPEGVERRPGGKFSVIELLVVVIIIGILAVIAIPIYIAVQELHP